MNYIFIRCYVYFDFETIRFEVRGKKNHYFYYHKDDISTHSEFCRKHFLIVFYVGTFISPVILSTILTCMYVILAYVEKL